MLTQSDLGRRINAARKAQGLTQEQLGNALGVSAQAVSKWELGAKNLKPLGKVRN